MWFGHVCRAARTLAQGINELISSRLNQTGDWRSFVRVSNALRDALTRIISVAEAVANGARNHMLSLSIASARPYTLWSDASEQGGGFILLQFGFAGWFWPAHLQGIGIPTLEALALLVAIQTLEAQPSFDPSRPIEIGIDSESVLFAALRGRSTSHIIHSLLTYIYVTLNIEPTFFHINSAANPADPPSRPHIYNIYQIHLAGKILRRMTPYLRSIQPNSES